METSSGEFTSPLTYTLVSSDDHIDVFDLGVSDDRMQMSESDLILEAASELLQFVDGLDGLVLKTDGAEQGKPQEEPVAPPSHVLDHNYASASPIPAPHTKKSNQSVPRGLKKAHKKDELSLNRGFPLTATAGTETAQFSSELILLEAIVTWLV